jgi:hypothetical protein
MNLNQEFDFLQYTRSNSPLIIMMHPRSPAQAIPAFFIGTVSAASDTDFFFFGIVKYDVSVVVTQIPVLEAHTASC